MKIAIVDDTTSDIEVTRCTIAKVFPMAGLEVNGIECFTDGKAFADSYVPNTYDMIFMDAAKGQYINFMPDILRLLKSGGVLVSDNVLQDGDIVESRFAVTRRNRTIHSRPVVCLWLIDRIRLFLLFTSHDNHHFFCCHRCI